MSTRPNLERQMPISKLEAAQRQLNCSIRLYFGEEDIFAVHTLSRAAFRILYDLYPTVRSDGFSQNIEAIIFHMGWKRFNQVANFLKHAVSDPDGRQDLHVVKNISGSKTHRNVFSKTHTGFPQ